MGGLEWEETAGKLADFRGWPRSKTVAFTGFVVALGSLFLFVGFWFLFSASAASLEAAGHNIDTYNGYTVGQRILLHGKVLNVTFQDNHTIVALDTESEFTLFYFFVGGDARVVAALGSVIYAIAVLQQETFVGHVFQSWYVTSPNDIHPAWPVDATFAGFGLTGFSTFVGGTIAGRRPRR